MKIIKKLLSQDAKIALDLPDKKNLELVGISDFVDGCAPDVEFDIGVPQGTWHLILTSASYAPSTPEELNHWVPAVSEATVGKDLYMSLVRLSECNLQVRESEAQQEFKDLQEKLKTFDGDKPEHERLLSQLYHLEQEWLKVCTFKELQSRCHSSSIHCFEVPADGNCMLWAVKLLLDGEFIAPEVDSADPEHVAVVESLRQELAQGWRYFKSWLAWQKLCAAFHEQYLDELTPDPAAATTPPKKKNFTMPDKTPPADKTAQRKTKKVQQVDQCRKAALWKKDEPDLSLRKPGDNRKATPAEPDFDVPDLPMVQVPEVTERAFRRSCKKKTKPGERSRCRPSGSIWHPLI